MAFLCGGAALREGVVIDEVPHIGAGLSYLQTFDLRLNEEHPPLAKMLAALPLVLRGTHADYSSTSWTASRQFLPHAYLGEWVFGEWVLQRWNDSATTLAWARVPMLVLTLILGWVIYVYASRLGGAWGGILCLTMYVTSPLFLTFGALVLTDVAVTLFSLLTLWWFAAIWQTPSRKNVRWFALCLAGALLSKFSAGLLFFAFGLFGLSTRWRPVPGQPLARLDLHAWRRLRRRATLIGVLWAALAVYVFYFVFSWHQTSDVLYLVGHGSAWAPLRRVLMPPWLYLRGILVLAFSFVRPTFILGQRYPHGVWFYFPALFFLKSPSGFLGILAVSTGLAVTRKRSTVAGISQTGSSVIRPETAMQWRVFWVTLLLFVAASIAGHFDVSFRHFTIPMVLIILLLAPLPSLLQQLRQSSPTLARLMSAFIVLLAVSCVFAAIRAYPHYFPYFNALAGGRPAYRLASDSNVDWNQALPEVKQFADQHRQKQWEIDVYGLSDPAFAVPGAELWNCQRPTADDAGQWVVVSSNMILDTHNCGWLLEYPHEALAAGSMYAIRLPSPIPAAGAAGGPPLPADQREFVGFPMDIRVLFVDLYRNPDKIPDTVEALTAQFAAAAKEKKEHKMPSR
jgi:hypothetical protein